MENFRDPEILTQWKNLASKISSVVLERFKADDEIASHTFECGMVG